MLYVMTDGGDFSILYMYQNGVYPDKYGTKPESLKEILPFIGEKDEMVVITQGLTDWSFVKLYNLVKELMKVEFATFRVFSTIELATKDFDYTLVQGDLFYGKYTDIKKGKWGKPYKACFGSLYKAYGKKKEPICIDEDTMDDEIVKVNNEMPLHLVKVDIRNGVIK